MGCVLPSDVALTVTAWDRTPGQQTEGTNVTVFARGPRRQRRGSSCGRLAEEAAAGGDQGWAKGATWWSPAGSPWARCSRPRPSGQGPSFILFQWIFFSKNTEIELQKDRQVFQQTSGMGTAALVWGRQPRTGWRLCPARSRGNRRALGVTEAPGSARMSVKHSLPFPI